VEVRGDLFADIVLYILSISSRNLLFDQNACVYCQRQTESTNCAVGDAFLGHIKLYDHHVD
jgi:hypothetical protein